MPRTTLAIDDDVLEMAKHYAGSRSISLGHAVSDLIRQGLHKELGTRTVNGLIVFALPPDSPTVTSEDVRRADED